MLESSITIREFCRQKCRGKRWGSSIMGVEARAEEKPGTPDVAVLDNDTQLHCCRMTGPRQKQ